jgi:hypothetical protein
MKNWFCSWRLLFCQTYKAQDRPVGSGYCGGPDENGILVFGWFSPFKRLINSGYTFQNMHFNFMPTITQDLVASIYTGTPDTHGIVGNEWFSRMGKEMYCTDDASVSTLVMERRKRWNVTHKLTTTITDELRMGTNFKGKLLVWV